MFCGRRLIHRESVYGQTSPNLTFLLEITDVLRDKEEGDLPVCYQRSVQKPASLMYGGAYGMDSLHVLEGTKNAI